MLTPFASFMASLTPTNPAAQIANVHTLFNIVTTIILLPIGTKLVDLSFIILPEKPELEGKMQLKYLDFGIFTNDYHIGTSAIANTQLFNETQNMLDVAIDNVRKSFELLIDFNEDKYEKLQKNEEYINFLNKNIVEFTTSAISTEFPIEGSQTIGLFLKISADIERIGDHAMNIAQRAERLYKENKHFSHEAMDEIGIMSSLCVNILDELKIMNYDEFSGIVDKVDVIEENIDKTHHQFSVNQLSRLKDKRCTTENSVVYTKILTDFERIGDHGLNIAKGFYKAREAMKAMKMVKPEMIEEVNSENA